MYAEATGVRGIGIYANSTGGGKAAYFVGDVDVKGNITREYAEGSSNPAVPLAYAFINSDGTIASGTPNISAHWNSSSSTYEITIIGESYFLSDYVTVVTPAGDPFTVGTSSISGKLLIFIYNLSGTKVQGSFQFITYKP